MQEGHWRGRNPGTAAGFEQLPDNALQEEFRSTEQSDSSLHPDISTRMGPEDNPEREESGRENTVGKYHKLA